MYVVYINLLYFLSIFLFTYNKKSSFPKDPPTLSDRKRVKSETTFIAHGELQGSILGLLFSIVFNV